ncbi:MAG: hypothetical protein WCF92_03840 [bacterium]
MNIKIVVVFLELFELIVTIKPKSGITRTQAIMIAQTIWFRCHDHQPFNKELKTKDLYERAVTRARAESLIQWAKIVAFDKAKVSYYGSEVAIQEVENLSSLNLLFPPEEIYIYR